MSLDFNMIIPQLVWQPGPVVSLQCFEALREEKKKESNLVNYMLALNHSKCAFNKAETF